MTKFFTKLSGYQITLWLISSLVLGIFTGLVQLGYHEKDFQIQYAFASSEPFEIELEGKTLDLQENVAIVYPNEENPFVGAWGGLPTASAKESPYLLFQKQPESFKIIRYRQTSLDPYIFIFFKYYTHFPSLLKNTLEWFEEYPSPVRYKVIEEKILHYPDLETNIFLGTVKDNSYHLTAWFWSGMEYILLHSVLFALSLFPLLLLPRGIFRRFIHLAKHPMLLFLNTLLLGVWGTYNWALISLTGIFKEGLLLGITTWGSLTLLGFLTYSAFTSLIWSLGLKTFLFLRIVLLGLILALFIILFIQTGFLLYTTNLIQLEFFGMINKQTISFAFDTLTICLFIGLLGIACYLLYHEQKYHLSFPWALFLFTPSLILLSYSLSFSTGLILSKQGKVLYDVDKPLGRLTFSPFFQAPVDFVRQFRLYRELVNQPSSYQILNLQKLQESDIQANNSYALNLGESPSRFPAGEKPFKRIILLTIEGYRLAYIPEFNPVLKEIVKPYPFFSLPEIKDALVPHYYASATNTTISLLTLLNSHINYPGLRRGLGNLTEYPSLPHLLKQENFRTLSIRTAQREFDQLGEILEIMGINKVYEMETLDFVKEEDYQEAGLKTPNSWEYPSRLLFKEVLGHLDQAKMEGIPIFTHILNTDTHSPPLGMAMTNPANYGSLIYPDPFTNPIGLIKNTINVLSSTYRFAYDLDLFYKELQASNLWDEDTLFIVTADHSWASPDENLIPINPQVRGFDELPLFILSPRKLPKTTTDIYASHLDLAPTILDLAGIPKPIGYWGRSLYDPQTEGRKAWFNNNGSLSTLDANGTKELNFSAHPDLQDLYNKFFVDSVPAWDDRATDEENQ